MSWMTTADERPPRHSGREERPERPVGRCGPSAKEGRLAPTVLWTPCAERSENTGTELRDGRGPEPHQ